MDLLRSSAATQERIQESVLAGKLVDNLASDSPRKKRIAMVALQQSVPVGMFEQIISIVIANESDAEVRDAAYKLAGEIRKASESVMSSVSQVVADPSRPASERKLAVGVEAWND